jgi:hypothetical protein
MLNLWFMGFSLFVVEGVVVRERARVSLCFFAERMSKRMN